MGGAPLTFKNDAEVLAAFAKIRPGDRIRFHVRRGATQTDVVVAAQPMPDDKWRLWQRNGISPSR